MNTNIKDNKQEKQSLDAFIKLQRASNSLNHFLNKQLNDAGITENQFGTLEALFHLGPMCQKSISEKLLCSPGNMTTVVDNLVKNGHVIREIDPADRRCHHINLTKEGRVLINELFKTHRQNIILAFEVLTEKEQEVLSEYCKRLGTQKLLNNKKEDK
ncbi:MAG: MarR family transcriptional regulator [Candidatus Marinimicrobia bacterium]|jgi:MarR family 2-MHQ and catechol resistance regulon transcriptional repressor|nr:MarR family transcriptional regulator [Candidatus Neomarinimicrobiota bacterium]MBT3632875.1 MarR family transcriptional regulator [Candidatus Neomarinimicrobiota bacterium]MBT3681985.1 MarR family transcriptional regulator [Candidatus Neomarinimicrobiota bacterium]MBT3758986.1 MarR family transcriptional regulator [Candidatus Neomarinimicrobiota bacterium]MBT3895115.1 MarR family transcriptional regulator [Candidatus Neomarinimicrobiota bacterium]